MNQCHIERVFSAEFLKWISNSQFSNDFENLKVQLESGYPNYQKFIPTFLSGSPSSSNVLMLDKSNDIKPFYFPRSNHHQSLFKDLFPPNHKIDRNLLANILIERYNLPSFISVPLMIQINPKSMQSNHKYIRFHSLIPLGEILDLKENQDLIFSIITYNKGRNYAVADDFGFYLVSYLQSNPKFKFCLTNTSECSIFSRYILMNLILTYDPEFRGRITRQNFVSQDFIQILDGVSNFEKFKEIYQIFEALDIQKKDSLSFKDLLSYDHKRIHPKVLERVWRFLPGKKVNDRITFADFVVFVILLEEKELQASLNFWFRVCDIEEDGILSLGEMKIWFQYQKQMLKLMNTDTEKFKELVPQIMDMMGSNATQWTRRQIKESGSWVRLFNILIDPKLFYGYFELREDYANYN